MRTWQTKIGTGLAVTALAIALAGCAGGRTSGGAAEIADTAVLDSPTATLVVHGMSCPLCANNVDKQLLTVPGVQSVNVNMGTGEVKVSLAPNAGVTKARLAKAVDDSGFTLAEVRIP
jgi:copper chaperone CopZ